MRTAATLLAVLLCGIALSPARGSGRTIVLDHGFPLTDADGKTVNTADFADKFLLVYFGYTHCSDLCPTALSVMSEALNELGPAAAHVKPIFVTLDPERDRGLILRNFTASFDNRLTGLGGTPEEIAAIANALNIKYEKTLLDAEEYVVDHSTTLSLIAPGGRTAISITAAESSRIAAAIFDALARAGVPLDDVSNLGAYR